MHCSIKIRSKLAQKKKLNRLRCKAVLCAPFLSLCLAGSFGSLVIRTVRIGGAFSIFTAYECMNVWYYIVQYETGERAQPSFRISSLSRRICCARSLNSVGEAI